MKRLAKQKTAYLLLVTVLFTSINLSSCSKDDEETLPNLTQQEKDMIIKMREEEKLAKDVYDSLYNAHGTMVFNNISNSEQRHMNEVLTLLNKYGIPDPASPNPGEFNNPDLQNLYDQLVTQGTVSEVEALKVGATIEDLDIFDLDEFESLTNNDDIIRTFEFLNCGSRNHMRAFIGNLSNLNETYIPQFISQADFDAIINSPREQCNY